MAVTIKDIARIAGVSHPTVSRALRDDPVVAEKTAARIKQIAAELGYVPSAAARSLKTNRSRVLGVIVNRVADPFYSEVLDGIHEVLQADGYSLFLASSNNKFELEQVIVQAMVERRVDGLIVCSTYVSDLYRAKLGATGVPVVLVHNRAFEDSIHSIYHDDRYGGRQVTRHLLDLGHARIAFLGNARGGRVTEERLAGFLEETRAEGLSVPDDFVIQGADGQPGSGSDGMQQLLALPTQPTAIVCYNDMMAFGAIQTIERAGLQVPADCSVVGFDNIVLSEFFSPPLTTFDQPKYQLGREAANMMLRQLDVVASEDASVQPDILVLRGEILVRASTAPPPER